MLTGSHLPVVQAFGARAGQTLVYFFMCIAYTLTGNELQVTRNVPWKIRNCETKTSGSSNVCTIKIALKIVFASLMGINETRAPL